MRLFLVYILLFLIAAGSTTASETTMRTSLWLDIFNQEDSAPEWKFEKIGYNEIPRELNIRGLIVEAVRWQDKNGKRHILILTQTGIFPVTVNIKLKNEKVKVGDRAELNAYMFTARNKKSKYKMIWSVFDFQDCSRKDIYAGFLPRSLTITDINKNSIPEVAFIFTKSCRTGKEPATKKLIMYEGRHKYAIRGNTAAVSEKADASAAEMRVGKKLRSRPELKKFALQKWNSWLTDEFKYYSY